MLKKVIKFENFDGEQVEQAFYFNLNKSEMAELQAGKAGGYMKLLRQINEKKNVEDFINLIKEIILKSYGEKSVDGNSFVKTPEIANRFYCSPAYDILFMEFMDENHGPENFNNFLMGVVPKDVAEKASKMTDEEREALLG